MFISPWGKSHTSAGGLDIAGPHAIVDCSWLVALSNLADIPSPLIEPPPQHMFVNQWGKLFWAFCADTIRFLIGLRCLKQYFTWIRYLKLDTRSDPLPPPILNWFRIEIFSELLMSSVNCGQQFPYQLFSTFGPIPGSFQVQISVLFWQTPIQLRLRSVPGLVQQLSAYWMIKSKHKKEAPIYFWNIFISFLGLAYFRPLGFPLKFKIFLAA